MQRFDSWTLRLGNHFAELHRCGSKDSERSATLLVATESVVYDTQAGSRLKTVATTDSSEGEEVCQAEDSVKTDMLAGRMELVVVGGIGRFLSRRMEVVDS